MGGRSLAEVNAYERHVLGLLDFKLNINSREWGQWVALYQGCGTGAATTGPGMNMVAHQCNEGRVSVPFLLANIWHGIT
jgi:hypothetical protein